MVGARLEGSRARSLRIRAADSFTAALVGWFALANGIDQLRPHASRLEKDLVLLAFAAFCGVAGLFLVDLASSLRRRPGAARKIIPLVRFCAAVVVGGFLLSKMMEGCFATLAVIFFIAFLVLVFRALDEPARQLPDSSPMRSGVVWEGQPRSTPAPASQSAVMATGVRRKLDRLFALIASGITTGFLVGCARYFIDSASVEQSALAMKLFQISVLAVALVIRFALAVMIQGREHLKGWRAGLVGVDGFLTGTLLAAFMSSPRMPFSVYFQHLLERHPSSWIVAGVGLGLTFGLILSLIAKAVGSGFRKYLFDSDDLVTANPDGAYYAPAIAASPVLPAGVDTKRADSGGVTSYPTRSQPPSRIPSSLHTASTLGCSCLIAPLTLLASFLFLFVHEVIFPPKGPPKRPIDLPAGCPPSCEAMVLDNFDLTGFDLSGANLAEARFPDTVLRGADLRGSNLRGARLFWADLRDADLADADLSGADLRRAILLGARLERTILRGAYLREAALQDLDLSTADLQGADLRSASYSLATTWPPGFDVEKAGMYLAEGAAPDDRAP